MSASEIQLKKKLYFYTYNNYCKCRNTLTIIIVSVEIQFLRQTASKSAYRMKIIEVQIVSRSSYSKEKTPVSIPFNVFFIKDYNTL